MLLSKFLVLTFGKLGGGSSVNMLLYSRPQRSELDAWNTPGWSADEILKYMNKVCYSYKRRRLTMRTRS